MQVVQAQPHFWIFIRYDKDNSTVSRWETNDIESAIDWCRQIRSTHRANVRLISGNCADPIKPSVGEVLQSFEPIVFPFEEGWQPPVRRRSA